MYDPYMRRRPHLRFRFSLKTTLLWIGLLGVTLGTYRYLPPLCVICLFYMALVLPPLWDLARQRQLQAEEAIRNQS